MTFNEYMEEKIEKVIEAPAIALDKTVKLTESITGTVVEGKPAKTIAIYWNTLGPGLTTGAADDDPSGIATYSQQGAQTGVQLLWLALFSFPLMATVQEMCARIGIVTNRGLATNIRRHYPAWTVYCVAFLLLCANTLNLGADIGAMAKAVQLLAPNLNFVLLVVAFTIFITGLQIYTTYKVYARHLKFLALVLFAYIFSAFSITTINWTQVLFHGIVPQLKFSKDQIFLVTAVLGTTISPYLFFWQTSQEVEEKLLKKKGLTPINKQKNEHQVEKEIKHMRLDTWSGMFISNLVMFFIVVATASTLFTHGITNINTAADAAAALKPIAGQYTYFLFALGIIGAGLLAVPVLAGSSSYALAESFKWKTSLSRKLNEAYAFYGIIILSMLIGLGINFIGLDPIKALIYSAVINGIVAPVVLFFVVQISGNKSIMGKYKNNFITQLVGWTTVGVMGLTAAATIISSFFT